MEFEFINQPEKKPGHNCEACPNLGDYNDGHWSTHVCKHEQAPKVRMDSNFIKGRAYGNTLQATPAWCPLQESMK